MNLAARSPPIAADTKSAVAVIVRDTSR
jgi:hypothetical protein